MVLHSRIDLTSALILGTLCLTACSDEVAVDFEGDVLEGLLAAGVTATEIVPEDPEPGARYFDLWFDQPVDHAAPGGATFRQYGALIHFNDDAPTVVYTSGYGAGRLRRRAELTRMVGGNQLSLEYRYYRTSVPEPADWKYLDVAQASADFHAVVQLVRPLYDGPWLHTGGSKGGETVLHSRYLYPDDFDVGVAYVTPIRLANPDARYTDVLDTVGTTECRTQLRAAQRAIAERRTVMVDRATATGAPFTTLTVDYATEISIVELEWSFWQYRGITACSSIPAAGATDDELAQFLDDTSAPSAYSDPQLVDSYRGFVYQASTELGYPVFKHDHIQDLTIYDYQDLKPFLPAGVDGAALAFDPTFNQGLLAWAAADPGHLIIIDGQWDPWNAVPVILGGDARRYEVAEATHGASIAALGTAERGDIIERLTGWIAAPVSDPTTVRIAPDDRPGWSRDHRMLDRRW